MASWNKISPPPKDELVELVAHGYDTYEIGEMYHVNQSVAWKWLKCYDIPSPIGNFRGEDKFFCRCGERDVRNFSTHRPYTCKDCWAARQRKRRRLVKSVIIKMMGNCCFNCGFDKWISGLALHHVGIGKDPDANRILVWPISRILTELSRCILLCANCHTGHHGGDVTLEQYMPGPIMTMAEACDSLNLLHGERKLFCNKPKAQRGSKIDTSKRERTGNKLVSSARSTCGSKWSLMPSSRS